MTAFASIYRVVHFEHILLWPLSLNHAPQTHLRFALEFGDLIRVKHLPLPLLFYNRGNGGGLP